MATARERRAARGHSLDKRIENILHDKLAHFLSDIDFRLGQAYDVANRAEGRGSKVYAEDMNIPGRHFLTGYTVTANSPAAGSIAWANLHMVYNGTDTTITDGSTANKYVWWSPTTTPTALQSSNTKPTLAVGEVLLFMNTAGTPAVMLSDTNSSMPAVLKDSSVDAGSIIAKAVTSTALNDQAVVAGKIAGGAINSAGLFAGTPVDSTVLANNAVIAGKIATGGISASTQFAINVVDTNAIKGGAVTATELNGGAVTAGKIANGAINASTLFTSNVVDTNAIKGGAVTATELGTSAVTPSKLNILRHVLY